MKKSYLKDMVAYKPNQIDADIVLSANESKNYLFQEGTLFNQDTSRYPEANADSLRKALAKTWGLNYNHFIIGNGSTELLELMVKTYVNQKDVILTFEPSFSMYRVYAKIYNASLETVEIEQDGRMNMASFIEKAKEVKPKLIFLCSPNNPTGSMVKREDIMSLMLQTDAIVVVDEAYMDFADDSETMVKYVNAYDRLIVARTFSKAFGLAAYRIGYLVSNPSIIKDLLSIKLPYNVNQASIEVGKIALSKTKKVKAFISETMETRDYVINTLKDLNMVVYPSQGNFVFIKSDQNLYDILLSRGILIRSFNNNTYRMSIGSIDEMKQVIAILKEALS